jgi:hypothetical protein
MAETINTTKRKVRAALEARSRMGTAKSAAVTTTTVTVQMIIRAKVLLIPLHGIRLTGNPIAKALYL